jgi:hypothetical protein
LLSKTEENWHVINTFLKNNNYKSTIAFSIESLLELFVIPYLLVFFAYRYIE